MELRTNALLFPSTRNRGPASASVTLTFARDVERAVAAITGYSATFANREDHHLGQLDLALTTRVDPANRRNVVVEGSFGLRDWSGSWDDAYSGTVQLAVLADLVPVAPPAPGDARGDLVITDAEITQGIQHFRSALHLDAANVLTDNSDRLVASKPCGVRLWVDYDRNSGLPPIAAITGSLVVTDSAGIATTLAPLAPIAPKRESQIARGMRGDTLDFVIPEALCSGAVAIRASVRSLSDPTAFSRDFERTLVFETMVPVRVFAVGVNYTGPDVVAGQPTAAPVQADFTSIFGVTELLYPIPQVTQTGYMTMDYDGELKSDISKGCDKFGDLRDDVKDLRGDSTDIFYALVNAGVDTGSVGGCGGSGGAGVGIIGSQGTVAHELGHILGRRHAPCDNVTRCARPLNTDGSYPSFPGYDSDSIGEFGFDVSTGAVLQPGTAHDMMGYSGNAWISAYTYKALMTRIPIDGGGAAGPAQALAATRAVRPPWRTPIEIRERIPGPSEHLFLHLVVDRDRAVHRRPAFHFPTGPQAMPGRRTDFVLELRDADDRVLAAHCLRQEESWCNCGPEACLWPKSFSVAVPFDSSTRRLALYDCDTLIHDEKVPDPPSVRLDCKGGEDRLSPVIHCRWGAERESDAEALWYLLQWRDRRGTWRGVAPRTQRTAWDVPKSLWGRGGGTVALRVLASSGIATGVAECEVAFAWSGGNGGDGGKGDDGPRRVTIGLSGVGGLTGPAQGTVELPPIVRASVTDPAGATVPDAEVAWYGESGGMYGRGRSLHLDAVPLGVHVLRAAVANTSAGSGEASWLVERTRDARYFVHRGTLTYPEPDCTPGTVTVAPPRRARDDGNGGATHGHDHDTDDRTRHDHHDD